VIASWASYALFAAGIVLLLRGLILQRRERSLLGVGFIFYALALRTYAPLLPIGTRTPLETEDRIWGATFTVMGGWALLTLMTATIHAYRTNEVDWSKPAIKRDFAVLAIAAVASTFILRVALSGGYAPTTDFLNEYGSDPAVMVYEIVFVLWMVVPFGLLGYLTWKHTDDFGRSLTVIGCGVSVAWGAWKLIGVGAHLVGYDRIDIESPVSVALALTACFFVVSGLSLFTVRRVAKQVNLLLRYGWRRMIDDARHRSPRDTER